jgi:hypothetical protein
VPNHILNVCSKMIWWGWMRRRRWPPRRPTNALITAETRRPQIAAHWADLHPGDAVAESRLPGTEHPVQAKWVDAQLAPSLGAVSWGGLQTLLEVAIYQADPVGAEQQASAAARQRFVRLGRTTEHGLKVIIARATAGDAIWFTATIDRIADILARHGDTDTVAVRRSKAVGILAQPAEALQLLCQHQVAITPPPDLPGQRQRHPLTRRHRIRGSDLARSCELAQVQAS